MMGVRNDGCRDLHRERREVVRVLGTPCASSPADELTDTAEYDSGYEEVAFPVEGLA